MCYLHIHVLLQVPHQEIQQALERERKIASKLVALQELNEELLSVAKEQHRQLDAHAQRSSTESESEAEEQERMRPKTETASTEVANISWKHAALLKEAVFNTVAGTVNVRREAAARTPSITTLEEGDTDILEDMADHLPQVPDTPTAGSQKVQLMESIWQASTPMVGGDVPPKIGMSYVEPELVKTAEAPVYHSGSRPVPRPRKSLAAVKHSMTEVAEHSLEVAAQEFKKIREPKIAKLKGGYSANAALIFNSWLKDIDMCVQDHNLTEHEAVQLGKDYTIEHACGAVEFYLDTNDQWSYAGLIEHLRTSFESGETFSSLLGDFYARCQKPKEMEDQFVDLCCAVDLWSYRS